MDSSVKQLKNICIENNYNPLMYHFDRAANIHRDEIINAYNQGHRDGKEDWDFVMHKDISEYSNAQNYYNETFKN